VGGSLRQISGGEPMTCHITWRWAGRDLRNRWVSVLAISIVIAIGSGVYAGLGSTANWRRLTNDTSYELLRIHDLLVTTPPGVTVPEGTLFDLLDDLEPSVREFVTGSSERLVLPTQLETETDNGALLVAGEIVGAPTGADAPVNAVHLERGRRPAPEGGARLEVIIEQKFAAHHGLDVVSPLTFSGGATATAVGHGMGPEHFYITGTGDIGLFAEAAFAVIYADVATVRTITGVDGVNQLALRVALPAQVDRVRTAITNAASSRGLGATVSTRNDIESYRLLYDDIEGDQRVWRAITALVLGAAAIAAFNLVGRLVDAQRREIGVQMALGAPPGRIALRPLLAGAQIALFGAIAGIGVGVLIGRAIRSVFVEFLPMPVWLTPFQFEVYLRGAALGFIVPFAASLLAVRRILRVEPIDALRTAHLASGSNAAGRSSRHSLLVLPFRNVMRARRRTVLTALGVGAAIAALVAVFGMLDTFRATIARGEAELTTTGADRVLVQLRGLESLGGATFTAVTRLDAAGAVSQQLTLPAQVGDVGLLVTMLDLDDGVWRPSIVEAEREPIGTSPRIVLAAKAASDLGVAPGDDIVLRHVSAASGGFRVVSTKFVVGGLHPGPLRSLAYADLAVAEVFGLSGSVNRLEVLPRAGTGPASLQRALFELDSVSWAQPITSLTELFDDALEQFVSFLAIAAGAVLALALLIAFNTTAISVEERRREHATLFAFGLPVRRVVGIMATEAVVIGLLATAIGLVLGRVLTAWMVRVILAETVPEFGFDLVISSGTVAVAVAVGVIAVAATPLLLVGRLRRMDVPSALRVLE
jgi:putative ABC transport system permease protein